MKPETPECAVCGEAITHPSRGRRRRYCSRSCQARAYRARSRPAAPPRRSPPRRLTTVAVVRAAVELADREGLEGLSMRRLATELGVATASLYRHFPDRDTLLAEMAELTLAETPPPPADLTGWRDGLGYEALGEWRLYRRHPWMLPVLAQTRPPLGPTLLDSLERAFTALYRPGMTRESMLTVYLSVSGLVQGLALLLTSERAPLGPQTTAEDVVEMVTPESHPMLVRYFENEAGGLDLDLDRLLGDCLALLFEGIAARHYPTEHAPSGAPDR
ncbi:TetR family transcriptional regulator [Nocardia otitidiscaviarum]|uniref:TetR family transcriptional regulator n=1 Tax=Nocardia otitidiscaviarum TaxID=1823 RepID=A0A516NWH3_9NOCA|nr:TetR/AcrR family transcriptional regulator [Nocardia otitidiscaviarum]MCP9619954.1 TetR/AcrR family transcriptional regulator [Nocardia otitidiscaviarum]QDP83269.1 TetR family transcriptional regulator [Nocardia otitidiscaviarum]